MWYVVTHEDASWQLEPTLVCGTLHHISGASGERERLDPDLLDLENPFEIDDGNRKHLHKHLPEDDHGRPVAVGPEDILDAYIYGDPNFFPADECGVADWLMVGMVPGLVICVPIAPPDSGDARFCRPIGIYKPSVEDRNRYLRGENDE
jgi:hypothetical protein